MLGFSPGANFGSPNYYASPAHYHASPDYNSPAGQSPIYAGGQPMSLTSPHYIATSPIYQGPMTSQRQGNGAIYVQSNRHGTGQNQSPQYSPNALQSPLPGGYNPNMCSSPVYMPGMNGSSAGSGNAGGVPGSSTGKSPAYSPTQNIKSLISPGGRIGPSPLGATDLRASPSYSPTAMSKSLHFHFLFKYPNLLFFSFYRQARHVRLHSECQPSNEDATEQSANQYARPDEIAGSSWARSARDAHRANPISSIHPSLTSLSRSSCWPDSTVSRRRCPPSRLHLPAIKSTLQPNSAEPRKVSTLLFTSFCQDIQVLYKLRSYTSPY